MLYALFFSGSGLLEFGEFCQLAAKFLVEEDDEALKKELKEAFRIYDKDQQGFITTGESEMMENEWMKVESLLRLQNIQMMGWVHNL